MRDDDEFTLTGGGRAWAVFALHRVGIDATLSECNEFLERILFKGAPGMVGGSTRHVTIEQADLDRAKAHLKQRDPGKAYRTKANVRLDLASELLLTSDGRIAVREAMKRLEKQHLLELFGL